MKFSQLIGIVASLLIIIGCFLPWCYYANENWLITGMNTIGTQYGKPGILHIFFTVLSIICFAIPKRWSKRTNIFICAMNIAWTIRNYMLLSTCVAGECPDKRYGFYLVAFASVLMLIMACLPKMEVE